ncbi:Outer membrane lipoprotein carrier protein LolA [Thermodesulfovibrio sp. N1]|nr:Outer membrane lipoprotein carrier protein LolA [Thermodesulfovibrio sp. N1]
MIGIIKDMKISIITKITQLNVILSVTKNLILFLILLSLPSLTFAQNGISKLEDAYKNINDISGSFTQTSYIKDLDKIQQFKGRFFIKGDKIRWQYTGEHSQTIYINKKTLIVYDKKRKQAIQSEFNEEKYGQLPLALLGRMADLKKDFEVTEKSENTILLIPKSKMGNIKTIEVRIADGDFPVKSMKVLDASANTIKIDFSNVKINTNLKDSIFKFTPKKDDTVLKY